MREGTSLRGARAADCAAEKNCISQGVVPKYSVGVSPTMVISKLVSKCESNGTLLVLFKNLQTQPVFEA